MREWELRGGLVEKKACVFVFLIDDDDCAVLLKNSLSGTIGVIGGYVEREKNPEECLAWILQEDLGLPPDDSLQVWRTIECDDKTISIYWDIVWGSVDALNQQITDGYKLCTVETSRIHTTELPKWLQSYMIEFLKEKKRPPKVYLKSILKNFK
jgi:hypothetical protein